MSDMRAIKAWVVINKSGKPLGFGLPFIFRTRALAKDEAAAMDRLGDPNGPYRAVRCTISIETP